jgi:hypothetical protein
MRTLLLAVLLLPLAAFADEVRIAIGMSPDEAVALIRKHGGTDITSGQQILVPKGEALPTGIYWAFRGYDAIIKLSVRSGTVVHIAYWTEEDFSEDKIHRAKTEREITALKIDTTTRKVSIEKKKDAD